jgi:hypothetical protein
MKKTTKSAFSAAKKSRVIDVGYRGKMFYLSDLLLHVIGFG